MDGQKSRERLVGRVDVGLYEAKLTGRDRTVAATHPEQRADEAQPEAFRESPQIDIGPP
jgi:hypothetical protein